RKRLVARLQAVQLEELHALVDLKNWESALEFATRLAQGYAGQNDIQGQIIGQVGRLVQESLKEGRYDVTRSGVQLLEAEFPNNAELGQIRDQLSARAKEYLERARAQESQGNLQDANKNLEMAAKIDPSLPALQSFRSRLGKKNPVLYVCVHD